jgi:hypothetical protein
MAKALNSIRLFMFISPVVIRRNTPSGERSLTREVLLITSRWRASMTLAHAWPNEP